jgi:hypothetical protein
MINHTISKYITYKNVTLFVLLLSFFVLLRWNHFTAPFERDEGVYAYSAWLLKQGLNPYEFSFPYKPPMIIYTFLAAQFVFGDNVWGIRIISSIFSFLTVLVVSLIAKHYKGMKAFWVTAFLLSVMLVLPVNFGRGLLADIYYAANTEIFMVLPLAGVLYIYITKRDKATLFHWFVSGVLSSIAVSYKPINILVLVTIYLFWLVQTWKVRRSILDITVNVALAFLGGLISGVVIYLPFILFDYGRAIWKQLIGFTGCYSDMGNWDYSLGQFFGRIYLMSRYYWSIFLLALIFAIHKSKDRLFLIALLAASYLSVYQSIIGHYYILIMPPLALIAGVALTRTCEKFNKPWWLALILLLVILIWPIKSMMGKTPQQLGVWVYGNIDQFIEAEVVGKKISGMTDKDDYVFIQGMDPEILYFTGRRSAVKMEWTNFLIEDCPALAGYNREYINDLKVNTPEVIAVCISGSCGGLWKDPKARGFLGELTEEIKNNYNFVGGWYPKGDSGYWLEEETENLEGFRTVVYKRK